MTTKGRRSDPEELRSADRPMRQGLCRLTGLQGRFVDAHLLPKALTRHHTPGQVFIQTRGALRPIRRRTSWYDPALVTRTGEDILSGYDNWAIREFRSNRMVWSSWGTGRHLSASDHESIPGTPYGNRRIAGIDPARLRLFFLSILWRAAATSLQEFDEVSVQPDDLEKLRAMVEGGDETPLDFFPVSLTQLSTIGPVHNHGPIAQTKAIPAFEGHPATDIPIFRFYFDGLIAHFARDAMPGFTDSWLGPQAVGFGPELAVSTVTYEASFQRENLSEVTFEAESRWPDEMSRLYRATGSRPERDDL